MRPGWWKVAVISAFSGLVGSSCGGEGEAGGVGSVTAVVTQVSTTDALTTTTAPATTVATTVAVPEEAPVFSFSTSDDVNEWFVVNDTVMGGVSSGQLAWEDDALVFTGDLSLDNNGGFASVRSPLLDATAVTTWADSDGMRIEVGGDGRTWTVEVRLDFGDVGGWISEIATSADEFVVVDVPWASFEPVTRFLDPRETTETLDPARIVSVAFYLVDGIEAPFRLELRSLA
jgi:hypothetical protein